MRSWFAPIADFRRLLWGIPHRLGAGAAVSVRGRLRFWSMLRYSSWRLLKGERPLIVTLRSGLRLVLRPPPALDLTTAHDIFVSEIYEPAVGCGAGRGSLIVDVGANVGYSSLYFAGRFRESRVLAYEPHPSFTPLFERHMALNGFTSRVKLVKAAAHTSAGTAILTNAEDSSSLIDRPESGTIPVPTIDFFAAVGIEPVSLIKMDIEGAELALLADPRFETLDVHMLLLEWHDPSGSGKKKAWCHQRLTALGFVVSQGRQDGPNTGLFTAVRNRPAGAGRVREGVRR